MTLPQFELSTYTSQLFWLFITLIILYFCLKKITLPLIEKTLNLRETYVTQRLKTVKQLTEQSLALVEQRNLEIAKAHKQAHDEMLQYSYKIEEKSLQKKYRIKQKMLKELQSTQKQLDDNRKKISEQIETIKIDLAKAILTRIME